MVLPTLNVVDLKVMLAQEFHPALRNVECMLSK